jgi:hypothetical protein
LGKERKSDEMLKASIITVLNGWKVEKEFIDEISKRAFSLFINLRESARGTRFRNVLKECCYLACCENGVPVPHKPSKFYRMILKKIGYIPKREPERYIPVICKRLNLESKEPEITQLANAFLNKIPEDLKIRTKERKLVAAVVYLALEQLGHSKTVREISEVTYVSEGPIRDTLKQLIELTGFQPKIGLTRAIPQEEWERKKAELHEYLRKNPKATSKDVREKGFGDVLWKFYRNRITEAKIEAKVPREFIHRKGCQSRPELKTF